MSLVAVYLIVPRNIGSNLLKQLPLQTTFGQIYLDWSLGETHPMQPIRAKLATEFIVAELGSAVEVIEPITEELKPLVRSAIESVHDSRHVSRVLDQYRDGHWDGENPGNAAALLAMFSGTYRLVQSLKEGKIRVGFNPQGAKHHALKGESSGFCVFNDFAWAARELESLGYRPLYIDWDIHAGDGVQEMLADTDIPTISIHNGTIFPTGSDTRDRNKYGQRHFWHNPSKHWYNINLTDTDGDDGLLWAMDQATEIIDEYQPDIILLAAGADGHVGSPLASNTFTQAGFRSAAERIAALANKYANGRVLIGGAGGYQPYKETPETWATVVSTIYRNTLVKE